MVARWVAGFLDLTRGSPFNASLRAYYSSSLWVHFSFCIAQGILMCLSSGFKKNMRAHSNIRPSFVIRRDSLGASPFAAPGTPRARFRMLVIKTDDAHNFKIITVVQKEKWFKRMERQRKSEGNHDRTTSLFRNNSNSSKAVTRRVLHRIAILFPFIISVVPIIFPVNSEIWACIFLRWTLA